MPERGRQMTPAQAGSPASSIPKWSAVVRRTVVSELRVQGGIAIPLAMINLTWIAKLAITTAFLGQLGELQLAGGMLGFSFANVTGFSVLLGLCGAMEPICGQAHGARNHKLLHKTLLMATLLLLMISIPISILWLNVDKILVQLGQKQDIAYMAKQYTTYLLPELVISSFLYPLKAYLSSQEVTLPTLFSFALGLAFHVPLNILLAKAKGFQGVIMAIWLTDLSILLILTVYVYSMERKTKSDNGKTLWEEGGWWSDRKLLDWLQLLRLSGPCCLITCLEWWCWEIMVLLTGRLHDAQRMLAVIAVILNFDFLLFAVVFALGACASIRVANELGAGQAQAARGSAYISVGISIIGGMLGAIATISVRGHWGSLFSHDKETVRGVRKMMKFMALVEVVNFPTAVCSGIVRGTARPWLGIFANIGGFYIVALPLAIVLAFSVRLGLRGLLLGFLTGSAISVILLLTFIACIDWEKEAGKAKRLAGVSTRAEYQQEDIVGMELAEVAEGNRGVK